MTYLVAIAIGLMTVLISTAMFMSTDSSRIRWRTQTVRQAISAVVDESATTMQGISREYVRSINTLLQEARMTSAVRNGSSASSQIQPGSQVNQPPVITIDTSGISSTEIDQVVERLARQMTVIAGQSVKNVEATRRIEELCHHKVITFEETMQFFAALDPSVTFSEPMAKIRDDFHKQSLYAYVETLHELYALGARNIKAEVARALDRYPIGSRGGGSGGFFAGASLNAKIGIGSRPAVDIIDIDVNSGSSEPKQRFDGFVVGETGFDDEFGGLRNGRG